MHNTPFNRALPVDTDAFLYPVQQQSAYVLAKRVYDDRKSHKKSRATKEQVWPEYLEVALIEGLMTFKPNLRARETRHLGRFPFRNKHISEYIYRKTGIIRDPKQVGSRLQQLGEYAKETIDENVRLQLEDLLAPDSFSSPSSSRSPSHSPPSSPQLSVSSVDGDNTHWIDILPANVHPTASSSARPIHMLEPVVCFTSQMAQTSGTISSCTVFDVETQEVLSYTNDQLVYTGQRYVEQKGSLCYCYNVFLAPSYWPVLVHSSNPTRFAIKQVIRDENGTTLCDTLHRFRYPSYHPASEDPSWRADMHRLPEDWDSVYSSSNPRRGVFNDAFTYQPLHR